MITHAEESVTPKVPKDKYSAFVYFMRLFLPLAALVVVVGVFVGSGYHNDKFEPVEASQDRPDTKDITKNELVNPRFESRDKKGQPYNITADRAIQGTDNKDLIMLEKPVGNMEMAGGKTLKIISETGAYRQDTQRFFLQGDVLMEHEDGYSLQSQETHIDLDKKLAWSDVAVRGEGPDMSITAEGVRANTETGHVVFKGPAKLVLDNGLSGVQ